MTLGVLSAAVLVAISTVSHANTITKYSNSTNVVAGDPTSLTFDQFDSSYGTLTAVTWQAVVTARDDSVDVTNNNGTEASVTVFKTNAVTIQGQTTTLTQSSGLLTLSADGHSIYNLPSSSSNLFGSASDISGYIGNSTVTYDVTSSSSWMLQGNGQDSKFSIFDSGSLYDVNLTVTYVFDPVPTPEAASLGILGMGGFGLLIGRSKKKD